MCPRSKPIFGLDQNRNDTKSQIEVLKLRNEVANNLKLSMYQEINGIFSDEIRCYGSPNSEEELQDLLKIGALNWSEDESLTSVNSTQEHYRNGYASALNFKKYSIANATTYTSKHKVNSIKYKRM